MFPVEYGPSYDGALHILLWELLSKLEKVFTVPDLKQVNQRGGLGSGGFWGDVRGSGGLFGGLGAAVDHHVRTILFGHTCKMNVGAGIVSHPTSLVSRRRLG